MSNIENFAQADFGESMTEGFEAHGNGSPAIPAPHQFDHGPVGPLQGGGPYIPQMQADQETNTQQGIMNENEVISTAAANAIVEATNNNQGAGSLPNDGGAGLALTGNGGVGTGLGHMNEAGSYNEAGDVIQTGGDGFRLGVDQEMVGGQAVVGGYDTEQGACGGYGEELNNTNDVVNNQVGGGSPFNLITDPDTNTSFSIFSAQGKSLLKKYVKAFKQMQSGGAALLDGVDPNAKGALYDGVQNAGAENFPDACNRTYDASQDVWMHTQVGGGNKGDGGGGEK